MIVNLLLRFILKVLGKGVDRSWSAGRELSTGYYCVLLFGIILFVAGDGVRMEESCASPGEGGSLTIGVVLAGAFSRGRLGGAG